MSNNNQNRRTNLPPTTPPSGGVAHAVKPEDPAMVEVPVHRANWFVRMWRRATGWMRRAGHRTAESTTGFARGVGKYTVRAWDWTTIRTRMAATSAVTSVVFIVRYILAMPLRVVGYIWNRNTKAEYEVIKADRVMNRAERRAQNRETRRAAKAAANAAGAMAARPALV